MSTVQRCDAIDALERLAAGSVSLIMSDLPAGCTKAPTDIPPDLERFWPAAWRALKPDGQLVLLAATIEFAARVIASQKAAFRYDIVWEKRRATGFYNARRMPLRAHEHVLVFGTGARTYNPQMSSGHRPINAYRRREGAHGANYNAGTPEKQTRSGATDRMPRSVVRTSSDAHNTGRRHHQQKPLALGLYLVATYSNAGDLIVDPYAGSGRFGDAAEQLGRSFIGFDIDPEWGSGAPRKS